MIIKRIQAICISFLFFSAFLLCAPTTAKAQTVFTDDFSNEYEKWQDVRNTFNLWSIVSEQANVFVNKRSTLAELIPKDEYWDDSWKNYVYSLEYTYIEGADKLLSFWFKDVLNWYQFHFVGNMYILSHIKNGAEIWKQTGPLVLEAGKKHFMELHLEDGNIKFIMDGIQRFEYFDPTFENDHGRIGLKAGAGAIFPTHVLFDSISVSLITQVTEILLTISPLKQTDPLWRDVEYDSSQDWAENSFGIGDWGCLTTSIAMVLNYHGISQLPSGEQITPLTLNAWLNSQADGYLGEGLVNWSAVTRLVRQIHQTYGTVKLEYKKVPGSVLNSAITAIQNTHPVILEIPGHFVVGNGITQSQDDLFITDPGYAYTKLSEHQTELVSTRLLTPSYTDLSFIHIVHDDSIEVTVTKSDGDLGDTYTQSPQQLRTLSKSEQSAISIHHEIAKPESGEYQITVTAHPTAEDKSVHKKYTLTIFTYDTEANLTDLTYTGVAGTSNNQTLLTLLYNKTGNSTLSSGVSFQHLNSDIDSLKQKSEISKHYVAYELSQLAQAGSTATSENKKRVIAALQKTMEWYAPFITPTAHSVLNERLTELQHLLP